MESPILRIAITGLLTLLVLAASMAIGYRAHGTPGLAAGGLGFLVGLIMVSLSALFMRRARTAGGNALLAAMYGSVLASCAVLITTLLVLHYVWPLAVRTTVLTALAVYLVYRFTAAFDAWPVAGGPARREASRGTARREPEPDRGEAREDDAREN